MDIQIKAMTQNETTVDLPLNITLSFKFTINNLFTNILFLNELLKFNTRTMH